MLNGLPCENIPYGVEAPTSQPRKMHVRVLKRKRPANEGDAVTFEKVLRLVRWDARSFGVFSIASDIDSSYGDLPVIRVPESIARDSEPRRAHLEQDNYMTKDPSICKYMTLYMCIDRKGAPSEYLAGHRVYRKITQLSEALDHRSKVMQVINFQLKSKSPSYTSRRKRRSGLYLQGGDEVLLTFPTLFVGSTEDCHSRNLPVSQ